MINDVSKNERIKILKYKIYVDSTEKLSFEKIINNRDHNKTDIS